MSRTAQLLPLDPHHYVPHEFHREGRTWPETNCYVDLWLEQLHALQLDPVAALAFTVRLDYEGDQVTFFKFPLQDLEELYGLETMEHQVWRPLPETILTQLQRRRPVLVELDAFHLPDTQGTSYRTEHVKTSVAVNEIDLDRRRLGYFHGRGYFVLEGEDFEGAFRLGESDARLLPPYFEIVKLERLRREGPEELRAIARRQLARHLARLPRENPLRAYQRDFARDLEWLRSQPLQAFHQYSFATVRMMGANFECAASFARWLGGAEEAAHAFDSLSATAKAMQFRLARVANQKKAYDGTSSLDSMALAWEAGIAALRRAV